MIRIVLPHPLRSLAGVEGEVVLDAATIGEAIDALEAAHPALRGTVRDAGSGQRAAGSGQRRPFVRFYAEREDLSYRPLDDPLPASVTSGEEPLLVVGAMAGG